MNVPSCCFEKSADLCSKKGGADTASGGIILSAEYDTNYDAMVRTFGTRKKKHLRCSRI